MDIINKVIRKYLQIRSNRIYKKNDLGRKLDKGVITIYHDYERHYHHQSVNAYSDIGVTKILEIEKKYNIQATYNIVAKLIKDVEPTINMIKKEGHEIASHSYSHLIMRSLGKQGLENDIIQSKKLFHSYNLKLAGLRSPQSKWCFEQLPIMLKHGMLWSAENDMADFPYVIYKHNQKELLRMPIRLDDWGYEEKNATPNDMFNNFKGQIESIAHKKSYGAIGFHPWVQGKDNERIKAFNSIVEYAVNNKRIDILTFSQASRLFKNS